MAKVAFELPVDNFERATAFYKTVFGWTSEMLPFESAVIDTDGNPVDPDNSAGVFTKRNELVKAPVLIITVDSIDDVLLKIKAAGGEVLTEKEQVADYGFSAYGKDTEGTVFCLWEEMTAVQKEWLTKLAQEGFQELRVCPIPPNEDLPEHTHDVHSVHIVLDGGLIIQENGVEKTYLPGERVDFPAGTTHIARGKTNSGTMIVGEKK